ncbi:MAG: potassium/proton antiporter [Hyphomicrobiaceae bacterium]|nr:potassium/proton antiporter [Hyphomicrobiaceae bacterium]
MAQLDYAHLLLLIGAVLVLAGILSSLIANRFGAPLLLVFLVVGMVAGDERVAGFKFSNLFLTYLVGSAALAVILFDGGLRTRFARLKGALAPAGVLATLGVPITALVVAAAAVPLFGMSWTEGFLLGAIVASTDAAAVFFLMRSGGLQLKPRVSAILEVESGTNDPVAVFLVILATEMLLASGETLGLEAIALKLAIQIVVGGAVGYAGGYGLVWLLNKVELPGGLHPIFVLASALFLFAIAALVHGSGFLAVYVAGLMIGNKPVRAFPSIAGFHDGATWLAQIVMFLVLGLLASIDNLMRYALPAVLVAAVLMLVARPVAVALCLTPFRFSLKEMTFVSWVGLRGAVSIFLAAIPMLAGVKGAEVYFNIAFFIVFLSLIIQGWTIPTAARRLGLALKRTTPEVHRVELDLPGQTNQEMAGYPVTEDSPVMRERALPAWARLVLVVRGGAILDAASAGDLRPNDYAYLLVPPTKVPRLDRLFAPGHEERPVFGDLAIDPSIKMADLVAFYGIEIEADEVELSLAEFIEAREGGSAELGDRITLGPVSLVVRGMDGDSITKTSLHLADLDFDFDAPPKKATLAGRLLKRLARLGRKPAV